MATGAMMISAARWPKMKQNCRELIIGVPAAPPDTVNRLKQILEHHDKVIVPYSSPSFRAVAQFYKDFEQVTDNKVKLIIKDVVTRSTSSLWRMRRVYNTVCLDNVGTTGIEPVIFSPP